MNRARKPLVVRRSAGSVKAGAYGSRGRPAPATSTTCCARARWPMPEDLASPPDPGTMADAEAPIAGFSIADPPPETDDEAIARLAKLPPLEFERARDAEAERLKVRVSILDKLV